MQNPNGSLKDDTYAETDSSFSYNDISIIKILGYNPEYIIDLSKAIKYILSCQNFDEGFGSIPEAKSHGFIIFVVLVFYL